MPVKLVIDFATGDEEYVPLSEAEIAQRAKDEQEHAERLKGGGPSHDEP